MQAGTQRLVVNCYGRWSAAWMCSLLCSFAYDGFSVRLSVPCCVRHPTLHGSGIVPPPSETPANNVGFEEKSQRQVGTLRVPFHTKGGGICRVGEPEGGERNGWQK